MFIVRLRFLVSSGDFVHVALARHSEQAPSALALRNGQFHRAYRQGLDLGVHGLFIMVSAFDLEYHIDVVELVAHGHALLGADKHKAPAKFE